jgi:hypothetical protein
VHVVLPDAGAAAVGICDERCRERKQTDCEHDERAVQRGDLAHRSLLSGVIEFLRSRSGRALIAQPQFANQLQTALVETDGKAVR